MRMVIFLTVVDGTCVRAEEFNTSFLKGNIASVDWNTTRQMSPGLYELDVYINKEWRGKFTLKLSNDNRWHIDRDAALAMGVADTERVLKALPKNEQWCAVSLLTHGGEEKLNSGQLRLDLIIPQAYVIKKDSHWIAPSQWDEGIGGLYTSYNFSYYHSWRKDGLKDIDNIFLTMNSGLNIATWHLIDKSVFRKDSTLGNGYWSNNERYLERAVPGIHSVIRLGDSYTDSPWFDNIRFRGMTLKQELRMYPDTYQTYMPVIRGVAHSNATVRVYQNGDPIHQVNVPQGAFEINDLMPTGSRSDMTVIVENADGSRESFTVPYSTVTDMLRTGTSEWLLNLGKAEIRNVKYHPEFLQGSFSHGLDNYLTLYGGSTLSEKYQSFMGGAAFSIPHAGSLSANIDMANSSPGDGEKYSGQRYKLSWSRYFYTRTNLTLATYYYNTHNYLSFYDTVRTNSFIKDGYELDRYHLSKQTYSVNLEQYFGEDLGRLALQGYWRSYWNSAQKNNEYSLRYSNTWRDITYSLTASRQHYEYSRDSDTAAYNEANYGQRYKKQSESRLDFSVTIPLTLFDTNTSITSSMTLRDKKYSSSTVGLSGATQSVDYNVNFTDNHDSSYQTSGAYMSWRNPWSKITGSYTESTDYRQAGLGSSGTLLLWRDGLLASGQTGNTFVILDAPGVADAVANGNPALRTNHRGQALVPSASAYRMNNFRLDESSSSQAELLGNVGRTAPWFGGISYVRYQTDQRKVFTYRGAMSDGQHFPFGATVLDKNGQETGYVAQGSTLYVKAESSPGPLYIRFSDRDGNLRRCVITLPSEEQKNVCNIVAR